MAVIHYQQASTRGVGELTFDTDEQLAEVALKIAQAFQQGRGCWIGVGGDESTIEFIPANFPLRLELEGPLDVDLMTRLGDVTRGLETIDDSRPFDFETGD